MNERSFSAGRRRAVTSLYDLRITVDRIEGRSVCGLQVGDYFEVTESSRVRIPDGRHFCMFAIAAALPLLAAKQRKQPAGDWLEKDSLVTCPDPEERLVMRIERMLNLAEYKRRQAAPGVKVTLKNFGRDRRYPIVNRFQDLGQALPEPDRALVKGAAIAKAGAADFFDHDGVRLAESYQTFSIYLAKYPYG